MTNLIKHLLIAPILLSSIAGCSDLIGSSVNTVEVMDYLHNASEAPPIEQVLIDQSKLSFYKVEGRGLAGIEIKGDKYYTPKFKSMSKALAISNPKFLYIYKHNLKLETIDEASLDISALCFVKESTNCIPIFPLER